MIARRACGALAAALVALAACDEPATAPASGRTRGPGAPSGAAPEATTPPPSSAARTRPRTVEPRGVRAQGGASTVGTPSAAPAPEMPPPPDLEAVLRGAFGTPTACISDATRARLGARLVVRVSVTVTASGRVTRADVSAAGLSDDDRTCMRQHAETLQLGSIPDAPRTITASIEYQVRATGAEPAPAGPPPVALQPGQVAPSQTLPALGSTEPAPGQVPADRALPAGGTETERPPGFIPPSHTLPALAE